MFQAAMWGVRTTVSIVKLHTDWEAIECKRNLKAEKDNARENSKRNVHGYKIGGKILIVRKKNKLSAKRKGICIYQSK